MSDGVAGRGTNSAPMPPPVDVRKKQRVYARKQSVVLSEFTGCKVRETHDAALLSVTVRSRLIREHKGTDGRCVPHVIRTRVARGWWGSQTRIRIRVGRHHRWHVDT